MSAPIGSVEVEDQIGAAIDDRRQIRETRRCVHHAENAQPCGDAIQIAERTLQTAEDCQRCEPRGRIRLFDREIDAYFTKWSRHATIGAERSMPGDVCAISGYANE